MEFFAGSAAITNALREKCIPTASLDILMWKEYIEAEQLKPDPRPDPEGNAMDINEPSGFLSLCKHLFLKTYGVLKLAAIAPWQTRPQAGHACDSPLQTWIDLSFWHGLFKLGGSLQSFIGEVIFPAAGLLREALCEGWKRDDGEAWTFNHWSQRITLHNMSDVGIQLRLATLRVVLLLYLVQAIGGLWTLEQPVSSLAYRHPRFRELIRKIRVFRLGFWLSKWGGLSPKRLRLWSNSKAIAYFHTAPLTKAQRDKLPVRLAKTSTNAQGKKTFTGDKQALKGSQSYPQLFYEFTYHATFI